MQKSVKLGGAMEISGGSIIIITIIFIIAIIIISIAAENRKLSKMTPDALKQYIKIKEREHKESKEKEEELKWGKIRPMIVCPQCQTKGFVRTKSVKRKKGVSGAKVTGALFTAGFSILATGLSRKEGLTQAHCDNCDSTWDF